MNIKDLNVPHTNQRLLIEELLGRGVVITPIIPQLELFQAELGSHRELLLDRDSSITPYAASLISSNKSMAKVLLKRAGISVPRGQQFYPDQKAECIQYSQQLSFPLVLKPVCGSHGEGCWIGILNTSELDQRIDEFLTLFDSDTPFLVEEQFSGHEYRIFVTQNRKYAVLNRIPASVTGDGCSTIEELARKESNRRMNPRKNCLTPIVLDEMVVACLAKSSLTLSSIPELGQVITLRKTSNLAHGGNCEDVTDQMHPEYLAIALEVLKQFPNLPFAGIDVMATSISQQPTSANHVVLEVNSNPGIHMHMRPGIGSGRNVASYIADLIFPESANHD